MNSVSFASATWTSGIRDDKVYIEIWDGETRILDANLNPEHARQLGELLIDNARKQGAHGTTKEL